MASTINENKKAAHIHQKNNCYNTGCGKNVFLAFRASEIDKSSTSLPAWS